MQMPPRRAPSSYLILAAVVAALTAQSGCGDVSRSNEAAAATGEPITADRGEVAKAEPAPEIERPPEGGASADAKPGEHTRVTTEQNHAGSLGLAGGEASGKIKSGASKGKRDHFKKNAAPKPKPKRVAGALAPRGGSAATNTPAPVAPPSKDRLQPDPVVRRADGDGTFESAGVNPFVSTAHDALSTFSIDVDTGSFTYAKGLVARGQLPAQASVRVEEWVNAFHYSYPGPQGDKPFSVHLAGAPSPFVGDGDRDANRRKVLRVGIQGKRLSNIERNPAHITFLVDVSGSMGSARKLSLVKESMAAAVNHLRGDDYVAIVTYAGRTEEVLATTSVDDKSKILNAIEDLRTGGGTNMGTGMELAFRNAGMHLAQGVTSRVVVLSDGDANIGRTRHEDILKTVRGYVSEGVTLSTVGFGNGNYNDHLMEQLADAGNGNYSYIDSASTAERVFGTDLVANLQVIAQDVKIQVEFNTEHVRDYRLLGYENRDIADADFRNDKKDAGEIGAGHSVTAVYEVSLNKERISDDDVLATVRIRHKTPRHMKATEQAHTFRAGQILERLNDADDDTRQALAVAMIAEQLRGSPYADEALAKRAIALLPAPHGEYAAERREFSTMAKTLVQKRDALGQVVRTKTTKLTITATQRSDVAINGRYVGETPLRELVLPANRTYKVTATTKRTQQTVMDIVEVGASTRQHHQLNIKALAGDGASRGEDGFLTLRTEPWAKVTIDGKPRGSSPQFKVALRPGKHVVRLVNENAKINVTKTVVIAPGKNQKVVWKLN